MTVLDSTTKGRLKKAVLRNPHQINDIRNATCLYEQVGMFIYE